MVPWQHWTLRPPAQSLAAHLLISGLFLPRRDLSFARGNGVVVVDMDGDGSEQTGWTMLYLHVATDGRVAKGEWVEQDDRIGHPSCEGGVSTGTHLHFARKYNGEWVLADGAIPFVLSDWTVFAGDNRTRANLSKGTRSLPRMYTARHAH